jgi:hypothetical protein
MTSSVQHQEADSRLRENLLNIALLVGLMKKTMHC